MVVDSEPESELDVSESSSLSLPLVPDGPESPTEVTLAISRGTRPYAEGIEVTDGQSQTGGSSSAASVYFSFLSW